MTHRLDGMGVIFDMDGVLIDSCAAHFESWRMLARELHAEMTEAQFASTFGRTSREIIQQVFGLHDAADVQRCDQRKEALYRDLIRHQMPAMPGAAELVRTLHAAGARIAVGSSGPPENVSLVCQMLGIQPSLSCVVTGADVVRGKPDPQVFQLAAERMGLQNRDCVVVEDAAVGIAAAHSAGSPCIALLGPHSHGDLRSADRCVDRLESITAQLIRELLAAWRLI